MNLKTLKPYFLSIGLLLAMGAAFGSAQMIFKFEKKAKNKVLGEKTETNINLLMVGDIMLDRHIETLVKRNGFDSLLGQLKKDKFFEGYDFLGGNLEGPATDKGAYYSPEKTIDFAFLPENVGALKNYGFNFFTLANNHFYDQGERGAKESRINLTKLGFEFAGDKEGGIHDDSSMILEKDGIKIGVLSLSNTYAKTSEIEIKNTIKDLKSKSDWVVVSIHWGEEYKHQPNDKQQALARLMIDSGADLIIGHHPHVIQTSENYKGKMIFYSLGNFLFDQYFKSDTQEGLALSLAFNRDVIEGKVYSLKSKTSALRLASVAEQEKMSKDYRYIFEFEVKK